MGGSCFLGGELTENLALPSLEEPRGGKVSVELLIDVDGEVGDAGPSMPSLWTMTAAKLF